MQVLILGQDKARCAVYGIPGEAMQAGAVDRDLPLAKLPFALVRHIHGHSDIKGERLGGLGGKTCRLAHQMIRCS